jgi:hypothetical protein
MRVGSVLLLVLVVIDQSSRSADRMGGWMDGWLHLYFYTTLLATAAAAAAVAAPNAQYRERVLFSPKFAF